MQITKQRARPVWPAKTPPEDDSRLLKNSEGNRHDAWTFCRRQETRMRNIRKMFEENLSQLLPETGRSRATNLKTQKKTKWIKMHQSTVKMCFLRGPLRWLTEQKNPKFLWTLQKAQRNTKNLAISRVFFGYSKLIFLFFVLYHFMLPGNFFCGSGIRHEIFMVINFGPAIFLGFYFCPHSITLGTRGFSRVRQEFSVLAEGRHVFGRWPKL